MATELAAPGAAASGFHPSRFPGDAAPSAGTSQSLTRASPAMAVQEAPTTIVANSQDRIFTDRASIRCLIGYFVVMIRKPILIGTSPLSGCFS
jgi:hypothetical protein